MSDKGHKVVKVDGIGTVAFPSHFTENDIQTAVASHRKRTSPSYSIQDVPAFLRPTAEKSKVVIQPPNGQDIAVVHPSTPTVVDVNERSQFGQPQLTHEETHVYQLSRNPAVQAQLAKVIAQQQQAGMFAPVAGQLPKAYTYGGTDGLLEAQRQHKTITDFGPEQWAEMARNYQLETQDAIRRGDAAELDKLDRAYGPYIQQMANLPGKNESMTTMTQKDLTPPAPGLPPAVESGILAPNPLLGGDERILYPLQHVKQRADELKAQFQKAGLSR